MFDFVISTSYPHDAPKVKCKTKVTPPICPSWWPAACSREWQVHIVFMALSLEQDSFSICFTLYLAKEQWWSVQLQSDALK